MNLDNKTLRDLFEIADRLGKRHYHKLTEENFANYQEYDHWRYITGSGSTQESKDWVRDHSDSHCPICNTRYHKDNGRSIDHKLPRAKYPWLSMDFKNLWVICYECNQEKSDMDWYEYERYIFTNYPKSYDRLKAFRPTQLLQELKS